MKFTIRSSETCVSGPFELNDSDESILRFVSQEVEEPSFENRAELVSLISDFLVDNVPLKALKDVLDCVDVKLEELHASGAAFKAALGKSPIDEVERTLIASDVVDLEEDEFTTLPTLKTAYESEEAYLKEQNRSPDLSSKTDENGIMITHLGEWSGLRPNTVYDVWVGGLPVARQHG